MKRFAERIEKGDRYGFVLAYLCSPVSANVAEEFKERCSRIVAAIRNKPKEMSIFMPYNAHSHWNLSVVYPWADQVIYINPIGSNQNIPDDFKRLMTT